MTVTDLRAEDRSNPLGVDERHPRLGWSLQSNQRSQAQSTYQVLVASSEANPASDRGDRWDSGKAVSSQSVVVVYRDRSLTQAAARTTGHRAAP